MATIKIKIQIVGLDGKEMRNFDDNVDISLPIKNLKDIWKSKYNMEFEMIKFKDMILEDDKNLRYYDVREGSVITHQSTDNYINLNVELKSVNPNYQPITIKIDRFKTSSQLKADLQKMVSFNLDSGYLTHRGRPLRDNETLSEQNIRNNDTIQVSMRVHGG